MTAAIATERLLADWWPYAHQQLQTLHPRAAELQPELAQAVGGNRLQLHAAHWTFVAGECRLVRIEGISSEIVNILGFPADPRSIPTFVAEGLVFGGRLRLAFVDLQTPGMDETRAAAVARQTARLHEQFGQPPLTPALPAWAIAHSPGHYFAARADEQADLSCLDTAFRAYLDLWIAWCAAAAPARANRDGLDEFKRSHLRDWPGTDYLARLFGADWSRRFIHDFLYR